MNDMVHQKLFTIAIPTYNRANYLDISLNQIWKQIHGKEYLVEVIVSNNNSPDNTEEIVKKYIQIGLSINYIKNIKNIGAAKNVIQCFSRAQSKYVLVLADDDCLADNSLDKILKILCSGDYGIVYLRSYSYVSDFRKEKPVNHTKKEYIYKNKIEFIKIINYFCTFLSGNIINKSIIDNALNLKIFENTHLPQEIWILSAMFGTNPNVYVEDLLIAVKTDNTGNYPLCKVFGIEFNKIQEYFLKRGIEKRYFNIIRNKTLQEFFPFWIARFRNNSLKGFSTEDYFQNLYPIFKKNPFFWFYTAPIIKAPVFLLNPIRKIQNLILFFTKDNFISALIGVIKRKFLSK